VAQAGTTEELLVADIAPGGPADPALSYMAQRRPELYGLLAEPLSDALDDRAAPST